MVKEATDLSTVTTAGDRLDRRRLMR